MWTQIWGADMKNRIWMVMKLYAGVQINKMLLMECLKTEVNIY